MLKSAVLDATASGEAVNGAPARTAAAIAVDEVVALLGGLRRGVDEMGRPGLVDLAAGVARARGALDALEAAVAGAVDALDDRGAGAASVLRSVGGCSQREADRRARRGSALANMPNAADALASGHLTAEHVDALALAASETSPRTVDDSKLVDQMTRRPADLAAREARDWVRVHRPDDSTTSRHEQQRRRRKAVVFRDAESMTALWARWDDVAAAEITTAVNSEMNRLFRLDGGRGTAEAVRSIEQRRADAVHNLICGIGGEPDGGDGPACDARGEHTDRSPPNRPRRPAPRRAGPRHQIVVVAELGVIDGTNPDGRCELADGTPVPRAVLDRYACNSELFGLVFSGDGAPLWHGRGRRSASDAQLRALAARDRGCVSCGQPPQTCEAHHIVPWQEPARGPTDIDNLVLLCSHHHHLVHDHRWRLRRLEPRSPTNELDPSQRPPAAEAPRARWVLEPPADAS